MIHFLKTSINKIKGYQSLKIDNHKFHCDTDHLYFWEKVNKKIWEPETIQLYNKLLNKNSTYVDIGAWIGPTTLYASKLCKMAYAFEPDPVAYKYLIENIHLNKLSNVAPFNLGINTQVSLSKMNSQSKS